MENTSTPKTKCDSECLVLIDPRRRPEIETTGYKCIQMAPRHNYRSGVTDCPYYNHGGPEAEQMVGPVVDTTEPPTTNGEVKPEETPVTKPTEPTEPTKEPEPEEPIVPADTTSPTVVEIG